LAHIAVSADETKLDTKLFGHRSYVRSAARAGKTLVRARARQAPSPGDSPLDGSVFLIRATSRAESSPIGSTSTNGLTVRWAAASAEVETLDKPGWETLVTQPGRVYLPVVSPADLAQVTLELTKTIPDE
jgi:hypothetical protein